MFLQASRNDYFPKANGRRAIAVFRPSRPVTAAGSIGPPQAWS